VDEERGVVMVRFDVVGESYSDFWLEDVAGEVKRSIYNLFKYRLS
jgi:hypothetical protein